MHRLAVIAALFLTPILASCGGKQEATVANQQEGAASNGASNDREAGILDRSHAGTTAPATRFQNPDGGDVSLADFRERPVLLNLWATWCGPCITEMPALDALAARQSRIKVLTVSQDLDGKDKVDAFFAKYGFRNIEPYADTQAQLSTDVRVQTLPTTILFDAEGREVWRITGIEDWNGTRAAALLKEAAAS